MQLLGKSLKKIFYEYNKKLSLSMLKNIGIQILDILQSIHNRFIIHRDIKLSCFFIDNYTNFDIYIVDFGFSFDSTKIMNHLMIEPIHVEILSTFVLKMF